MNSRDTNLRLIETALLVVGLALVAYAAFRYVSGRLYSRAALESFYSSSQSQSTNSLRSVTQVDYTHWSPKRIKQYEAALTEHFDPPLAVLKMDKIQLEVPVFEGTSDRVLNRGAGRIEGTAHIGESGNVGIAAHRDSFFRGLKEVRVGDSIELETTAGTQTYVIDSIKLVDPKDVSVLKNQSIPELTLVTCFPFYFAGSAPQRYIVRAYLRGETKTLNEPVKASLQAAASRTKESTK
jgi:sortase A